MEKNDFSLLLEKATESYDKGNAKLVSTLLEMAIRLSVSEAEVKSMLHRSIYSQPTG